MNPPRSASPWARFRTPSLFLSAALFAAAGSAHAQTIFVDFEQLTTAPCVFSQTGPLKEQLASLGIHFSGPTSIDGGAVLDTCGGFQVQPRSGVKFLAFSSNASAWPGGGRPIDPEAVSFDQRVTSVEIWVASGNVQATFRIDAFDGAALVGSNTISTGQVWAPLSVSVAGGFTRVVIDGSPTVFLCDDLSFTLGASATPYCSGDGTATACPCGNAGAVGHGCASSVSAGGGHLGGAGGASVAADTFVLTGSLLPNSSALYFQGTQRLNGGNGLVFGDGLRCVGGSIIRLGTKVNSGGTSSYPVAGDTTISVKGSLNPGDVRQYQVWYRNAAAFCTASTFNLSNGLEVAWTP